LYELTFTVFAFIISMVPFSVALNSSVYRCIEWKESLRIALVFAVFHALMAAAGWGVGYAVKGWLHSMDIPIALFIMFFMALRYFVDARRKARELRTITVENIRILFSFAIVTGINTLLLGISLGILYPGVFHFIWILFAMVFMLSVFGIRAGKRGWMNLGRTAETLGSLLLFGAGIFILLQFLKLL